MKLNLGCGKKKLEGFVNVDISASADVACDVQELPWPDGVADEVMAIHLLEHVPVQNVALVLKEWARVLKPGGRMVIEMPDRDKVFEFIRDGVDDPRLVLYPLWGDPRTHRTTVDVHRWCWTKHEVAALMRDAGLTDIVSETPHFHIAIRDMRLVGVKGADHQ